MKKKLMDQLVKHEGERLFAYLCPADRWTIGVGRNIDERGGKGITKDESRLLLNNDIDECVEDLRRIFPRWLTFTDNRKVALVDMRFNLGPSRFRSFRRMIAAINRDDWTDAGKEAMDSKWAREDVGKRRSRLIYAQLVIG